MVDFTKPEELRDRFAELQTQRANILAQSGPKRDARDDLIRSTAARVASADAEIKTIEANLFDLDQEAALIARALGGRTGG